jgi:hypothetical protein
MIRDALPLAGIVTDKKMRVSDAGGREKGKREGMFKWI